MLNHSYSHLPLCPCVSAAMDCGVEQFYVVMHLASPSGCQQTTKGRYQRGRALYQHPGHAASRDQLHVRWVGSMCCELGGWGLVPTQAASPLQA